MARTALARIVRSGQAALPVGYCGCDGLRMSAPVPASSTSISTGTRHGVGGDMSLRGVGEY